VPFKIVRINIVRANIAALVECYTVADKNVVGDDHVVGRTGIFVVVAATEDDAAAIVEDRVVGNRLVAIVVPAVDTEPSHLVDDVVRDLRIWRNHIDTVVIATTTNVMNNVADNLNVCSAVVTFGFDACRALAGTGRVPVDIVNVVALRGRIRTADVEPNRGRGARAINLETADIGVRPFEVQPPTILAPHFSSETYAMWP